MRADSIEKIIEFLRSKGIKANCEQIEGAGFNRVIEFEIEKTTYFIEWWINQSYFKIKNEFSTPHLPFKYIAINRNSPTNLHNLQLCFYDEPIKAGHDSLFPFGCMKIPFNLKS